MRICGLVVLAFLLLTVACDHKPIVTPTRAESSVESSSDESPARPTPTPAVVVDAQPTRSSSFDAATQGALAAGTNAFGIDLYRVLRKARGNIAVSPFSVSMGFTMAWAGARGETAAQMRKVLHAASAPDATLDAEARLLATFRQPAEGVTLRVANRLFGERTYTFEAAYLERTKAAFGAPLEPLDFVTAPGAARLHINDWVATATEQHITNLIPPSGVTKATRLVVADAVYFLGAWAEPFNPRVTAPSAFHASATRSKDVAMMHQRGPYRFAHTDGVRVLEVPYAAGRVAMTFVLPDAIDGLEEVESRLTSPTLDGWFGALVPSPTVLVTLPRFKIEPAAIGLRSELVDLGMTLAFDPRAADFTGIANPPRPEERLYISDAFHRSLVKIDEQGTEAVAATAVVMARPLLERRDPHPEEFTADHPFLFFVRDLETGLVLFMGRVNELD